MRVHNLESVSIKPTIPRREVTFIEYSVENIVIMCHPLRRDFFYAKELAAELIY